MSVELMQQAKKLILARHYDEARKLLNTVNTPEATKWLAKLDEIAPRPTQPVKPIVSPDELFKKAKMLMKNGEFDKARYILQQMEHPMATQWLAKLNQVAPPPSTAHSSPSTSPLLDEVSSSKEMPSLEESLEEAKELMKARQFDKARNILQTLNHPTATLWLLKLNEIAPPPASEPSTFDFISDEQATETSAFDFIPDEPTTETSAFDFIPNEPATETSASDFIPDEPVTEPSASDFIPDEPVTEPSAFDFIPDEPVTETPAFDFVSDEPIAESSAELDFDFKFDEEIAEPDFDSINEVSEPSFNLGGEETTTQSVLTFVEDDSLPMPNIEDVLGETYQANLAVVSEETLSDTTTVSTNNLPGYAQANIVSASGNSGEDDSSNVEEAVKALNKTAGTVNKAIMMLLFGVMGGSCGTIIGFMVDMVLSLNTGIFCCSLNLLGLIAGVALGYFVDWGKLKGNSNNPVGNIINLFGG